MRLVKLVAVVTSTSASRLDWRDAYVFYVRAKFRGTYRG